MNSNRVLFLVVILILAATCNLFAAEKPYILVSNDPGEINQKADTIKAELTENGFEIVGSYKPNLQSIVLVFTNDELKKNASLSDFGAFGASLRFAVTQSDSLIQVSYTNPKYWANAYRLKSDNGEIASKLENMFGKVSDFGSKKGLEVKKLRKYHYMISMPYFDDLDLLGEFESYEEAISTIEKNLEIKKDNVSKVYKIEIPGKQEVVYGVALPNDAKILETIDQSELKHTAYLCYEFVVSQNKAYALNAKFRIALSFPDLSMKQFTKIISAPKEIKNYMKGICEK